MVGRSFELECIFPVRIRERLQQIEWKQSLEEIRVRIGQPMEFLYCEESKYLVIRGEVCEMVLADSDSWRKACVASMQDVVEMMNFISNYSLYAYKDEVRQGFITIEGGHRIGMAGAVALDGGEIIGLQPITFLNIRVAHECIGCADEVIAYICDGERVYNTLFFSEPGMGKTTLLRDCIRILSDGTSAWHGKKVCVVDERSELSACHIGVPQNDLGRRTDVLCGCGKAVGMQMLLRTMSPEVIAVDELGEEADFLAVEQAAYCGCHVIGTIHAGTICELREKPYLSRWLECGVFQRYVGISKENGVRRYEVFDTQMERIC